MKTTTTCLGIVAFVAIFTIGSSLLSGLVLSQLWAWFVVTTFKLPLLTIPVAIGLGFIARMFQPTPDLFDNTDKTDSQKIASAIVVGFGVPLLYLALGWAIHLFMAPAL